ncbi:MAG: putative arginyl-tRNA--protein transferase [Pseudomonadota bacterium]|jgi:arginine-tRNA-protein transferase
MSQLNDLPLSTLHFYLTAPYACSYLPNLSAHSQVATPAHLITRGIYSELVQQGFRRSGTYTYRPRCDTCQACKSIRIVAAEFLPSRSQRRAWQQHNALQTSLHTLDDKPEYYALYQRYQAARHKNGGMDNDDHEAYEKFLLRSDIESFIVEFREPCEPNAAGILRMVSVIDLLADGLSAVYTFFEPDLAHSSFGVYNVLWQIDLCRQLKLDFVYLGYWIKDSAKMTYKTQYQPAQVLQNGTWQPYLKDAA